MIVITAPVGTQLVRGIIMDLKRQGCTVLVNSHHLDEIERTCDRVAFIKKGKIQSIHTLKDGSLMHTGRTMRINLSPGSADVSSASNNATIEAIASRLGICIVETNH